MTGYEADEVLGRNCRFLQGPETDPARVDELRRAVREQRPATVELRNHRRDGSAFWNEVHVSPVRDERGEVVRFVGVQVDVTAYRDRQVEERRSAFLAEASPLLDASLDLRSTLDSLTRLSVPVPGRRLHRRRDPPATRSAGCPPPPPTRRSSGWCASCPSRYPVDPGDPVARVLETGRAEILTGAGDLRAGGAHRAACRPTSRARRCWCR